MAKRPDVVPITDEEREEIERRAYYLIRNFGKKDARTTSQYGPGALVFITYGSRHNIRIMTCDSFMEVRYAGRPDASGLYLYKEAWSKQKATNAFEYHAEEAKLALNAMRRLMILDDLADV